MPVITISGFLGENRNIHPKLLRDDVGTLSINQKPGKGDLRAWGVPTQVATVPTGRKTIYRMGRDVNDESLYWLSWSGFVHAVRGFDAQDATERTYFTGSGSPKVTDNIMALASAPYPTASRPLGVPAPATAPIVATEAYDPDAVVDGDTKTYFYVYTYVTDWGWESAPSPVSLQNDRPTIATAQISGFAAPPAGNYQINKIRVYRTQDASNGLTDFYYLGEFAYGTASVQDDNRALAEILPTTAWSVPPDDLSFLTSLWNGMLAGISGNSVRFCEPYTPYAWPIAYDVVPPDAKPVGLGVFGQSLLVLTTGRPLLVAGSSPEAMDQQPLAMAQACVAPKSIVSMGSGVAWASEDGLCWFGADGPKILTSGLIGRDEWQAMGPTTIVGRFYEGLYFGSYMDGSTRRGFVVDPSNPVGIFFLTYGFEAMHFDELKDQLYVLDSGIVKKWDGGDPMTYTFRSKVFKTPKPTNFSACEVVADAFPVTVKFYGDGALKYTKTVTGRDAFRLPAGFMATDWQFEIEGSHPVQSVSVANSPAELKSI